MKNKWISKKLLLLLLIVSALFLFAACEDNPEEKNENTEDKSETQLSDDIDQDFIIAGADENGKPLIFYNLNAVTSVEELEEYVDLGYDFEAKPELLLAEVEAPEGVFEEIKTMLDEKGVVYTIIEDVE